MKTIPTIALLFLLAAAGFSQDTTATQQFHWNGSLSLGTKNVWRGIDFGAGTPTAQGLLTFAASDDFDVNVLGITSLTGENRGYASTLNIFMNYRFGDFTLTVDNYYFQGDSTNIPTSFWDYKNTHFLEGRLAYEVKQFEFMAGYTLYGGGLYHTPDNKRGIYLEAKWNITEEVSLTAGGITGPSGLNFTDKAGITNIGLKYAKNIAVTERFGLLADFQLVVNPSHKNIAPLDMPRTGYGAQPVNFVVLLTIQ
jgi:hypothetical protein